MKSTGTFVNEFAINRLAAPLTALTILIGAACQARAGVILYSQSFPLTSVPGVFSNGPGSGAYAEEAQQIANSFTFATGGIPSALEWFGQSLDSAGGTSETFLLRLYSDNAGLPGSLLYEESASAAGAPAGPVGLYYTAPFTPGFLDAGTAYWLSIVETSPDSVSPGWQWSTFQSAAFSGAVRRGESPSPWTLGSTRQGQNFTITGVPEPSTIMLLGMGAGSLFRCRRRKKHAAGNDPANH